MKRTNIPTPSTCTEEVFNKLATALVAHYEPLISTNLLITNRRDVYGLIINTVVDGTTLENVVGSINAKVLTERTLDTLLQPINNISIA
jgi:hypothetical protein